MRRFCLILAALLASLSLGAQETLEARARRLQPIDIPPLTEKANAGDLASQALLRYAYAHGYAVTKDTAKALEWLRKSAEEGSADAQWDLAMYYRHGRNDLPKDSA